MCTGDHCYMNGCQVTLLCILRWSPSVEPGYVLSVRGANWPEQVCTGGERMRGGGLKRQVSLPCSRLQQLSGVKTPGGKRPVLGCR